MIYAVLDAGGGGAGFWGVAIIGPGASRALATTLNVNTEPGGNWLRFTE